MEDVDGILGLACALRLLSLHQFPGAQSIDFIHRASMLYHKHCIISPADITHGNVSEEGRMREQDLVAHQLCHSSVPCTMPSTV